MTPRYIHIGSLFVQGVLYAVFNCKRQTKGMRLYFTQIHNVSMRAATCPLTSKATALALSGCGAGPCVFLYFQKSIYLSIYGVK